jgi:FdhD protein
MSDGTGIYEPGRRRQPAGMDSQPPAWSVISQPLRWRGGWQDSVRELPEETAVALTYNRVTHAVMMATPADLRDFAVGFSLSEGVIESAGDIEDLAVVTVPQGIELRMWIAAPLMARLEQRRRRLAGATGCGMCGLESLAEAMRPAPSVGTGRDFSADEVLRAVASLAPAQALGSATRAVHAAGFWRPETGLVALREDVGRHNALDKLHGALTGLRVVPSDGMLVLTSRVSIELVQKASHMGATLLVAVSAPTALAMRVAEAAGITLVGVARPDGFEVFSHPCRITDAAAASRGPS